MIQRLEWDSGFFGFPIGQVEPGTLVADRLLDEASAGGYRCVYYQCGSGEAEALGQAARAGFVLVDIRVTLEVAVGAVRPGSPLDAPSGITVGPFEPDEIPALGRIAEQLSAQSRFAFDPGFGFERARRLYVEWIRVSCEGRADAVLVARRAGEPVGFVTCRCAGERARLELVAVDAAHASRGIGTSLVVAADAWLASSGVRLLRVATQGRNVAAVNFYARRGFGVADVGLTFHRWF